MDIGTFMLTTEMGLCKERVTRTQVLRRVSPATSSANSWFVSVTSVGVSVYVFTRNGRLASGLY